MANFPGEISVDTAIVASVLIRGRIDFSDARDRQRGFRAADFFESRVELGEDLFEIALGHRRVLGPRKKRAAVERRRAQPERTEPQHFAPLHPHNTKLSAPEALPIGAGACSHRRRSRFPSAPEAPEQVN